MGDGGVPIRIVLAEEQALFREAMRVVLDSQDDLEVVGHAKDGIASITEVERTGPDVVFLDANLPNCDGIRAAAQIRERAPGCKIVILSPEADVAGLMEALESGATGYLTKDSPLVDLIEAAREVHKGETVIPRGMLAGLLALLIRRRRAQDEASRKAARLTRREKEILGLLTSGADNHAIARELVISPETARTHIQKILAKLGVHSRLEAAAFVVRNDLADELMSASS